MRIILFTGKGGVGKTTLAAATAVKAASLGYQTLIISTDVAHSLADAFSIPLANEPTEVTPYPGLFAAELDTGVELERYWGDIKRKVAKALSEQGFEATIAGEIAVFPGLDEILSLVRLKNFFDEGRYDVLIIDSAPTGAAMRLLSAPDLNQMYLKNIVSLTSGIRKFLLPSLAQRRPALSS